MNRTKSKTTPRKAKSSAFEAILGVAGGLRRADVIDKKTMREYESLCLEPVKYVSPKEIARIREKAKLSQNLFARYLNTSPSTVQKWETGAKRPSGPAVKLLRVVERHGVKVLR